ncbi:hypothetical protein B296_00021821 [Ensete ventricosum]|uniref:Uncharacterized protein n=1 Tax=Ensete ventricosum TaxID=4639 RepID=A0A426ZJQ2_ENSVE|nr:hypothetical protein B296_00021821 [Ensete ventricosum]
MISRCETFGGPHTCSPPVPWRPRIGWCAGASLGWLLKVAQSGIRPRWSWLRRFEQASESPCSCCGWRAAYSSALGWHPPRMGYSRGKRFEKAKEEASEALEALKVCLASGAGLVVEGSVRRVEGRSTLE